MKHRPNLNTTHPLNPSKDPDLRPIWMKMQAEMDQHAQQWKLKNQVFKLQMKAIRKQYMQEHKQKERAKRDQQILDLHTRVENVQLREAARYEVQLQHQKEAVARNEAKSVALAKQQQYLIEKSALSEYRRLGADKRLLDQLEADSKHFVTLETLESHVNEELGKWVDEEGGVNAFGIQVLREDGQGQTVRPLLPDISDEFEEVAITDAPVQA